MIIQNESWLLRIDSFGAQWTSLIHKPTKREWLYQSDTTIWPRHAPLLFPIIGKLKENRYTVDNQPYQLNQHGFAREMEFEVLDHQSDFCQLKLSSDANSLRRYPFSFELIVSYRVLENGVAAWFEIKNISEKAMSYNFGGHPGFLIKPSSKTTIQLQTETQLKQVVLEQGFWKNLIPTSQTEYIFDEHLNVKDTLLWQGVNRCQVLMEKATLTMELENFPFFALWSPTPDNQQCLCLEPWSGLMDGVSEGAELSQKQYIWHLPTGQVNCHGFTVKIEGIDDEKVDRN